MPTLHIQAQDGSGEFSAYVAKPTQDNAPALLVIQEIFGVNQVMRDICDDFAKQGYLAICPDLFWRQEPDIQLTDKTQAEWDKAFELMNGFDVDKGVEDLKATLATIRNHENCTGKAGSIGYCLGGKLAFLMATRSDADCNVSYYGVGLNELVGEKENITKPLLMHVAEKDQFVPKDAQAVMEEHLKDHDNIDYNLYEGVDHAFARVGGDHYDAEAAALANGRTKTFLEMHLQEKP